MTAPPRPTREGGFARRSGAAPPRVRSRSCGGFGRTPAPSASPFRTQMTTFANLLATLARAEVRFLVVGGVAVTRLVDIPFTNRLELLVEGGAANLRRRIATLATFGSGAAAELDVSDFPVEEGAVRVAEDFDVDLFTLMSGHTYGDLLPLSEPHDVGGVAVRFLGAEGLIRLKADSLRPRDQANVAALRAILAGREPDR